MVEVARVFLWEIYVGAVFWDQTNRIASFAFDPGFFRYSWDIAPLTMSLSESGEGRIYSFPGIPAEMLCYIGKHGMGALEFRPATRIERGSSNVLEISELVDLAQQAVNRRGQLSADISEDQKQALLDIIRVGTSAGGARAKAVIAINRHGTVRSGQLDVPEGYSHWLIKLDGVTDEQLGDPKGYGRIENVYHLMAEDCGISMTECRLPYPDADQLYRRMVFNVIGVNNDDHTKNISFLMDKSGQWRLAPAYDMTYTFKPSHKYLAQHQLSINGKRSGINYTDLILVAERMNIRKPGEIIGQITDVIRNWPRYASSAGIPDSQIKSIGKTHLTRFPD
ncbi:MAG TPA: type II toxin-antitoxin system HipA family toxin [Bacteroidales bacterium]|nr:type II toxin-antitoxin system HipA family toxin [Bacteroidales bacterium]